jgi:GGDEF domain-containing protein
MLSKEDSRRLAQLERQLRRDDPDFCARMGGGNFSVPAPRPPLALFFVAAAIAVAAIVLGAVGWWIAAVTVAAWSLVTAAAAFYRRRKFRTS